MRDLDGVTSIMVTHQLRDAFNVARTFVLPQDGEYVPSMVEDISTLEGTEFLMLREGEVEFEGSAARAADLRRPVHPRVPVVPPPK